MPRLHPHTHFPAGTSCGHTHSLVDLITSIIYSPISPVSRSSPAGASKEQREEIDHVGLLSQFPLSCSRAVDRPCNNASLCKSTIRSFPVISAYLSIDLVKASVPSSSMGVQLYSGLPARKLKKHLLPP